MSKRNQNPPPRLSDAQVATLAKIAVEFLNNNGGNYPEPPPRATADPAEPERLDVRRIDQK